MKYRSNGDELHYKTQSNEFGVLRRWRYSDLLQAKQRAKLLESAMSQETLTAAERIALNGTAKRLFPDSPEQSFRGLVNKYRRFVDSVDGYGYSIYDYDNDLSVREMIDRILQSSPEDLRAKAFALVSDIDQSFMAKTIEMKRRIGNELGFGYVNWYSRLPRQPGPELASDIESGNL